MIDRGRVAAALIVLAAAGVTLYTLLPGDDAPPDPPARAAAVLPDAPSRADLLARWQADILARPLIYPGRRAPVQGLTADAAAPPEPLPRLAGVIIEPTRRSALFTAAPGARAIAVQEGARIGAYTVRSIGAKEVVVDGPDGARTLHPTYDGAAPGKRTALPAPRYG